MLSIWVWNSTLGFLSPCIKWGWSRKGLKSHWGNRSRRGAQRPGAGTESTVSSLTVNGGKWLQPQAPFRCITVSQKAREDQQETGTTTWQISKKSWMTYRYQTTLSLIAQSNLDLFQFADSNLEESSKRERKFEGVSVAKYNKKIQKGTFKLEEIEILSPTGRFQIFSQAL